MQFKVGQWVFLINPEYVELEGPAKIQEVIGERGLAVKIQFQDGGTFSVSTRLLREATPKEIALLNL